MLAASIVAGAGRAAEPADPSRAAILDLEVARSDEEVRVSFRVEGAFPVEMLERIHSGIPVTFRHRVELVARRPFPLVPSKVLGSVLVETTAKYDSLTRQYYLSLRTVRGEQEAEAAVEASSITSSLSEMQSWMTILREVTLPSPPPQDLARGRLRVRVRAVLGRRFRFFIFPASYAASGERRLES